MMGEIRLSDDFQQRLIAGLTDEVNKALDAEVKAAVEKVRNAIRSRLGHITLALLADYDVSRDRDGIIISVRNQQP